MVRTRLVRSLELDAPESAGRRAHIATASALVRLGKFLYVVPDDSLFIGRFEEGSRAPGSLFRLLEGELPLERMERKAHKPDWEAACALPPREDWPEGALLVVPSGSTP